MEFIEIDGSFGEGGGQIVRTALAISCILNLPIKIKNIRKGRTISGLKAQHLAILKILKKICDATFNEVTVGSTELQFVPKEIKNENLTEDVGTAGSIALILQVLIPVVAICKKKLKITIKGGTNVFWSPSIDYTQIILKELYERMGIKFSIKLIKRGYYPRGGGIIELEIFPAEKIQSINFGSRKTKNVKLFCTFSKLPFKLLENHIEDIKEKLIELGFSIHSEVKEEEAIDSGSSILISCIDKDSIIGFDSIFNKKTKKFDLDLDSFIHNDSSVDHNLADMIVLPASLAAGMTVFRVKKISKHLETNLYVVSKITGCKYGIGKLDDCYEIRIQGISASSIK